MSDGRFVTSYKPNCEINNAIQEKYNIKNSHDFRMFLQTNASTLMSEFSKNIKNENCVMCPVCNSELKKE